MFPRVVAAVLVAQADLAGLLVDLLDLDFDLLANLQDLAGMVDPLPAHLADVDQTVDAAQIDERAEVLQTADGPLAELTGGELGRRRNAHRDNTAHPRVACRRRRDEHRQRGAFGDT